MLDLRGPFADSLSSSRNRGLTLCSLKLIRHDGGETTELQQLHVNKEFLQPIRQMDTSSHQVQSIIDTAQRIDEYLVKVFGQPRTTNETFAKTPYAQLNKSQCRRAFCGRARCAQRYRPAMPPSSPLTLSVDFNWAVS